MLVSWSNLQKMCALLLTLSPYQLLGETRLTIPVIEGKVRCKDNEYIRNSTCSIFLYTEPLGGYRYVSPYEGRTNEDWFY